MKAVTLRNLVKTFGKTQVIHGINLEIEDTEIIVLVGPSGCGKSTILRMVAGLEEITEGEILINDRVVNNLAPKDRNVAMVFQNYALYPHMNVFNNMAFGLKLQKTPKEEIEERVNNTAKILNISELLARKPVQLSGELLVKTWKLAPLTQRANFPTRRQTGIGAFRMKPNLRRPSDGRPAF